MSNKLPIDLINHLKEDPDFDYQSFEFIHEKETKTTSIRLNRQKKVDKAHFAIAQPIPWCQEAYMLESRPSYTLDPLFHAGAYYAQEASSMFLDYCIRSLGIHNNPVRALDLCAAPGGKSTLLSNVLHPDSLLLANEIIKSRAAILKENLIKWGNANVVVSNNDPSAFGRLPGYFDLLVVDAPCSGSGMFHKDHNAISEWSLENVKLCKERQQRILANSIGCLSTGGYLFYSTCSYSKDENEDMLDWLIDEWGMESVDIPLPEADWGIEITTSSQHQATGYRFYPHKVMGEGFYIAVLRKKSEQVPFSLRRGKPEKNQAPIALVQKWVDMEGLYAFMFHDKIHIFPKRYELDLAALQQVLYIKNAGTEIGRLVGKELVPSHDLALSNGIRTDIQAVEMNLEACLTFLRKENLSEDWLPTPLTGWTLVQYKGINIGWIKAMPNRINNYYPKEMRIVNL